MLAVLLYRKPPLVVRVLAAVLMAFIAVCLLYSGVAGASTGQVTNEVEPFVQVDTWLLLLGVVTPFVTALITKSSASATVKALVSAVTIGLVAVVVTGLESGDLTVEKWFNGSVQVLAAHLATWLMAGNAVEKVNTSTPGVV